jgi:hypothetical protein
MLDTDITGDPDERRSLYYFRARTTDDLSGCFDSNFWNRLVLQLCHTEPAVKHAVVALGAAHEAYQAGGNSHIRNPGLALQEYNKSITCLNNRLSTPSNRSTEVTLICCVLFVCFECIRCNYDAALLHLSSGIEILKSKRRAIDPASYSDTPYLDLHIDEDIFELYARFDISTSAFLDIRPPQMPMRLSDDLVDFNQTPFQDLGEARRRLHTLVNLTLYLVMSHYQYRGMPDLLPVETESERSKLLVAVQQWASQFDAFLKSPRMVKLSSRDLQAAFTLIVHQKTILIMLEMSPYSDQSMMLRYDEEVERVISIASWLARPSSSFSPSLDLRRPSTNNLDTNSPAGSEPAPSFSADMGIIAPMYYLCMNCPSTTLRQKALDVLHNDGLPRREGLWDSRLIADIAEKAILPGSEDILKTFEGSVTDLADALGAVSSPLIN